MAGFLWTEILPQNPYFWNNLKNFKLYTMHIFCLRNYNITKFSLITLYSLLFSGNALHDVQKHLKYIKVSLLHFSYLQILVFNPCHDEYLYLLYSFAISVLVILFLLMTP